MRLLKPGWVSHEGTFLFVVVSCKYSPLYANLFLGVNYEFDSKVVQCGCPVHMLVLRDPLSMGSKDSCLQHFFHFEKGEMTLNPNLL